MEQKGNRVYKNILVSKKLRKNCHFFFFDFAIFSYRNLPYQAWITHAKFHKRRSNGSGGIMGEADLVKVAAVGKDSEKMDVYIVRGSYFLV